MRGIFCLVLILGSSAEAAAKTVDESVIDACFVEAAPENYRPDCLGLAANECQMSPEGSKTMGIVECLRAEAAVWDRLLNQTYQELQTELASRDGKAPFATSEELTTALRDAQRA